jgi:hypothetical protein
MITKCKKVKLGDFANFDYFARNIADWFMTEITGLTNDFKAIDKKNL